MKSARTVYLVLAVLILLAACAGERDPLQGTWRGQGSAGEPFTIVFRERNTALWITDRIPGVQDTLVLRYTVDTTYIPKHVNVSGFTSGPLAGMTLYGIYELEGTDSLHLDFEPGLPGESQVRPHDFRPAVSIFTRTE